MSGTRKLFIAAGVAVLALVAWNALFSGHSAAALRPIAADSTATAGLISSGESVDLAAFAQPAGFTVFEFMAPW